MTSKCIKYLLTFFLCAGISANCYSKTSITVVTEVLEPYQMQSLGGHLSGFSIDVVNALFEQLEETVDIDVMSWARAYQIALTQPNVMIFSIAQTPERLAKFKWIGNLIEEKLYFWALKSRFSESVNDIEQLKQYSIAASRRSNVAEYLDEKGFPNVHILIKEAQNMQMLFNGRVDMLVATELTVRTRAKRLNFNFDQLMKLNEVTELNNNLSIAFSLTTEDEVVEKYRSAYQTLQSNGTLAALRKKWNIE